MDEVKSEAGREPSPWAAGLTDNDRQVIEETSKQFGDFEAFWQAATAQLEAEGELTQSMELVAEKSGWSATLVRRRRTHESKSAQKRGRLTTGGDDMKN